MPRFPERAIGIGAFTLLELLVVVAILAVLAGLLLPVLHRAQAKAQGIHCLNNLRQMQMAWQMYTDDHAGWVPENQAELYRGIWRSTPNSRTGPSSAPFDTDTFAIEYGSLYRGGYAQSLPLFRCPSDDARVRNPEGGELDLAPGYRVAVAAIERAVRSHGIASAIFTCPL